MLFNEPKLLKRGCRRQILNDRKCFSALQRAEIAEMSRSRDATSSRSRGFSALQRAEIAEMRLTMWKRQYRCRFSALQRAEIAEISFGELPRT